MTSNGQGEFKPSLLVTVGSTLFPKLTDLILSDPLLDILAGRISFLKVQLGRATIPPHLASILDKFDGFRGIYKEMKVVLMDYTPDFEGLVNSSDMVISHAGISLSLYTTEGLEAERQDPGQS